MTLITRGFVSHLMGLNIIERVWKVWGTKRSWSISKYYCRSRIKKYWVKPRAPNPSMIHGAPADIRKGPFLTQEKTSYRWANLLGGGSRK